MDTGNLQVWSRLWQSEHCALPQQGPLVTPTAWHQEEKEGSCENQAVKCHIGHLGRIERQCGTGVSRITTQYGWGLQWGQRGSEARIAERPPGLEIIHVQAVQMTREEGRRTEDVHHL